MNQVIFSHTGNKRGSGSDRYRWVSGLNREEMAAVKAGHTVIIDGAPTHGGHLPVRKVIHQGYGYDCRTIQDTDLAKRALEHFGYNPVDFGFS